MQKVKIWWPAVMVCMMMGVTKIAVAAPEPVEEEAVAINTVNIFQIVDERFLSLTVDPAMLLFGSQFSYDRMRILNMARGLTPTYLRLGGPDCNHYHFLRSHMNGAQYDNYAITAVHWVDLNHFAQEAGLKLVACVNNLPRINGVWDSSNTMDLVAFSDEKGYDLAWELGYELQELGTDIPAAQYGKDVAKLRNILDAFPRYRNSLILGPDITRFNEQVDMEFLKNYFNEGGSALNGITWHPEFTHQDPNSIVKAEKVVMATDQLMHEMEVLNSILGSTVTIKPLWIGDKLSEASQGWFLDALVWAQKLGVAAQMGVQVIMRQPNLNGLFEPTPDYWVSLLHKALVGRVVLDVEQGHSNSNHFHMYCHCTNHHTSGLFGEAVSYKRGDVTCFGISHLSTKVKITLKLGSTRGWDDEVHQYLLTSAGNGQKTRETLMNGQPLNLGDKGTLPVMSPDIYHAGQSLVVTLPPTSIGFWVLSGVQAEACLVAPFNSTSEASTNIMCPNILRSTNSKQYHNLSNSDQGDNNHVPIESREYEFNDKISQYNEYTSKIMEDTISEKGKGDSESNSTKMVEEYDVNVKSKSVQKKKYDRERAAQGRYKRHVTESDKYLIPGLLPDYLQANNGITIQNLIQRRNMGGRLQNLPRISAHNSNIHSLLHEPYHHVRSDDVNEELPGVSSDKFKVNSFTSGNMYFKKGGTSPEEHKNDYDYVDTHENEYEEHEIIPSEMEYFNGPTKYFERFLKSGAAADEKFAGYRVELSEAESIASMKPRDQEFEERHDNNDYKVIKEQPLRAQENLKAKSTANRMLNIYYSDANKKDSSDELDIKKEISKRREAEKRSHESEYPDLSTLIAKLRKDVNTALGVLNNKYVNTDTPAEDNDIARSSHVIKDTATKSHGKNIPSIAEEYHQEGYGTRRHRTENSDLMSQRNDRRVTRYHGHEDNSQRADRELVNNTEAFSSSDGNTRFSKERIITISNKTIHDNSNENTSMDTSHNHYRHDSKSHITLKSLQNTAEDHYEDDEGQSRASKQSAQHNSKSELHNQRTDNKYDNSKKDEYSITDDWYVQINPTKVSEVDSEERVPKTYAIKRKRQYQQNISNSRDVNGVLESISAATGQNSTRSVNPGYRMKPSIKELSNLNRSESTTGGMVTQKTVPNEEQSEKESDGTYKNKHFSQTEVSSDGSIETTETYEQEEAMARKKANKSRQTNQVTMRMPKSSMEVRQRVRREVPSPLPILDTSQENGHMWTETKDETAQGKDKKPETTSDPINDVFQLKSQNINKNNHSQTAYKAVPVATIIKSYKDLQLNPSTKSSEGTNTDHSTRKYSSLKAHTHSSGNEYEKHIGATTGVGTNLRQKLGNTLVDKSHTELHKKAGTNQTYWELESDKSVEHFTDPEQSQNEGNTKREIGSDLMLEPYKYINISNNTVTHAVEDAAKQQHGSLLKTGSSEQEGKIQTATDISTGEIVTPVVMDRNSEPDNDATQQTRMVNNQEGITDMNKVKNTYKNEDSALLIKMYEDSLKPASGLIRLPKATDTHIGLQHVPGKVTTWGINYNDLISNREKYKHTKNIIMTEEDTGQPGVWNIAIPGKMVEALSVNNSSIHSGKGKPTKLEHKVVKIPHDLGSSFMFGHSNKGATVSETIASALSKKQHEIKLNNNQSEDKWSHMSEGRNTEEENLRVHGEHGDQSRGWPYEKTMQMYENGELSDSKHKYTEQGQKQEVTDVAKKTSGEITPLQTLAGNTASNNPSTNNNVKLYTTNNDRIDSAPISELHVGTTTKKVPNINYGRTETLANLKNSHEEVKKNEDKAFKMTHTNLGPKSAWQFSQDCDSDNNGLPNKVNAVTADLKTEIEKEQEYSAFSAEKVLKSVTDFTDGKLRTLSKKKETDVPHSKLEDIATNDISDDKNIADFLVRNPKDIGHLKPITAWKENSYPHSLDNTNDHIKLQISTLPKTDQMRTHLEKKRLDILHALMAQHAQLKENLLKIRVMAAGGKLKLPHHINRRDTTQNKLTGSLVSSGDTEDSNAQSSIQNDDENDSSNEYNPSIESQDFGDKDGDSSSHIQQNNDKYYFQDVYGLLKRIFLPVSIITHMNEIQVPVFGSQQVSKTQDYSESEILPTSSVLDKEDQSFVQQPKSFSSGDVPLPVLHHMGPKTMYEENLFPSWREEEKKVNTENISQISSLKSIHNKNAAESESLGEKRIEIKQLSLPLSLRRPGLLNDPMMVQSKIRPNGENEIKFFLNSESDEPDANDRDLTREESHTSSLLPEKGSNSPHTFMNLRGTDDTSLKESWKLHNNGNIRALLMSVTDKNKWKEDIKMTDESIGKERKHFKSSNKTNGSDKSFHSNRLDEGEPSTFRESETKNIKINETLCTTCDRHKNSFPFQTLKQDLGSNSEPTLGPGNSNTVPIRSRRTISYPFNDNLLKTSTINNNNPNIEDNMNGKYRLQNYFKNNWTGLRKPSKTGEIDSNMHQNVIMPMSNELIVSDVAPNSNMLLGSEDVKFNLEDIIPANSFYTTNINLTKDHKYKDSKHVTDENRLANQTILEVVGNFLNDILNAAAHGERCNKLQDVLREKANDINLQINEINRQFKISNSFLKHENSKIKADNGGEIDEIKNIPYKFHKHILNSNYEPAYHKIKKYSTPDKEKRLAENSVEFPDFNNTSKRSPESSVSHDANTVSEEKRRIATEHNIPNVLFDNNMTNRSTGIFIQPNVSNRGSGSFVTYQTYPQDNFNNLSESTKNFITLEQKAHDAVIVSTTEEGPQYSDVVKRDSEHEETGSRQQETEYTQRKNKSTSTTAHIHTFIKNISDNIVKFFHNIPPWNYSSP